MSESSYQTLVQIVNDMCPITYLSDKIIMILMNGYFNRIKDNLIPDNIDTIVLRRSLKLDHLPNFIDCDRIKSENILKNNMVKWIIRPSSIAGQKYMYHDNGNIIMNSFFAHE